MQNGKYEDKRNSKHHKIGTDQHQHGFGRGPWDRSIYEVYREEVNKVNAERQRYHEPDSR